MIGIIANAAHAVNNFLALYGIHITFALGLVGAVYGNRRWKRGRASIYKTTRTEFTGASNRQMKRLKRMGL